MSNREFRETEGIEQLAPEQMAKHPSAVRAVHSRLEHLNTYAPIPDFYIDRSFTCRKRREREIWKARDQKWSCEEAKGRIDAKAVECHECRKKRKAR